MSKILQTSKGFTLIELMISISIFSLVVAGIITSKTRQQGQNITQQQAVEMQQNVRAVMFLMKQELRMAGFNPYSQNYGAGISAAGVNTLTFAFVADDDCSDNDGDSADPGNCADPNVDEEGELDTIIYKLEDDDGDGDNDITKNAVIMAENIQNLGFTYFDEDGNITAATADVRSIQITVTATTDVDEFARATNNTTRTLTTIIYLRNMGL